MVMVYNKLSFPGYLRAASAARSRAPAVCRKRYGKTFAALTVSCECRAVTFRRCGMGLFLLLRWKSKMKSLFLTFVQRRVAAGAAIETLSISFELFENEICSAGASPILSELVEDKISPQASVSRNLRLSDWLDRALFNSLRVRFPYVFRVIR